MDDKNDPLVSELLDILERARELTARPENDFLWSSWSDAEEASADIDRHIERLRSAKPINTHALKILFAPTGDLQEVSINGGWDEEYLALSARFDDAIEAYSDRRWRRVLLRIFRR